MLDVGCWMLIRRFPAVPESSRNSKHRDENTKNQAPNTRKDPNHKLQGRRRHGQNWDWELGISLVLGAWCLVFLRGVAKTANLRAKTGRPFHHFQIMFQSTRS